MLKSSCSDRLQGALTVGQLLSSEDYAVRRERLNRVAGSRVLYADHPALAADFPELMGQTREGLDRWLVQNGALLSKANCRENAVNPAPALQGACRLAFRPPRYGRASLVAVSPLRPLDRARLIDVKGIGHFGDTVPNLDRHGSGLALLPDALREVLNRAVLNRLFRRERSRIATLPIYGVLDLGFTARSKDFAFPVPAVSLLRRAEIRWPNNYEIGTAGSQEEAVTSAIEAFLRRFGITSAAPSGRLIFRIEDGALRLALGDESFDNISERFLWELVRRAELEIPCEIEVNNVQIARDFAIDPLRATITDLEQYRNLDLRRSAGLLTFVSDRPFNWGRFVRPGEADWIAPDPESLAAVQAHYGPGPFSDLAVEVLGLDRAARSATDIEGSIRHAYHLAARIMVGRLDRNGLERCILRLARQIVPRRRRPGPGDVAPS